MSKKTIKISFFSTQVCYHEVIIEIDREPTNDELWMVVDEVWKNDEPRELKGGIRVKEVKWDVDCYTAEGPELVDAEDV